VIVVVPAETALTCPVEALIVATEVFDELQVPPDVPLELYVAVPPMQSGEVPLTVPADTFAFTVKEACALTGEPHPLFTV
jgi:hypothetical protein